MDSTDSVQSSGLLLMPAKPVSDNRLRQVQLVPIVMNGYQLDLSGAVDKVFKHQLNFYAINENKEERDITRGPKNDVAVASRRRALWSIYRTLIRENADFFGCDRTILFYDCGTTLYSINKLHSAQDGEKEFHLKMENLSAATVDFLRVKTVGVVAKMVACAEVRLRDTGALHEAVDERERSVQQFLEIALNQQMFHDQNHLMFGNKAFKKPSSRDKTLTGGKVLGEGFEKAVRFVGDSPQTAVGVVQIDAKKSAFFKEQGLFELVGSLCNNRTDALTTDQRARQNVAKQLKDLVVRTTHLPKKQRSFCIFGMTQESADRITIEVSGAKTTVAEYYQEKYSLTLRHPQLPCIVERKVVGGKALNSFFPIQVLTVIKGQRVPMKKQTPDLVDELISSCRLLPNQLRTEIETQRRSAKMTSNNSYMQSLGIRIADDLRRAEASVLAPPAIVYGEGNRIDPDRNGNLDWRLSVPRFMSQRKFLEPCEQPKRWVVFDVMRALGRDDIKNFIGALIHRAGIHGIRLQQPSRIEDINSCDTDAVIEKMKSMHRHKVEFVLFITRDKRDPVHDTLKLAEVLCKVTTQHVHSKTVLKAIGNRGADMTLDNILMKSNLKLGGITHGLASSAVFVRDNCLQPRHMEQVWLRETRMFIGFDLSHSAPQSLYERQAGICPSEPTVVGMAYSCESPFTMRGNYWMQEPRVAGIQWLKTHVIGALNEFKNYSPSHEYPEHVIVFRGGLSEGQYSEVMVGEASSLREAFNEAAGREIRLSVICVQTKSNYRLLPKDGASNGNAAQQNVRAGTCVDSLVVHPSQTEFILVPHKSIMGTARPIRCTVLVDDEPRMSLDEVEGVTHTLCYAHGIVTSAVSVPAHLYAASELAKRGRNNWKASNSVDDDVSTCEGGEQKGRYNNDGSPDFFASLSEHLAPTVKHKFWA